MNTMTDDSKPLEHLLSGTPQGLVSSEEWASLITFCRDMDNIGRVDVRTGEVYCDEMSVQVLLKRFLPEKAANQGLSKLKSASEGKIVNTLDQTGMTLMPVRLLGLASRIPGFKPSPDFTFADLGLNSSSTSLEIQKAVQQEFPGIPDQLFDLPTLKKRLQPLVDEPVTSLEQAESLTPGDIWNCLISNTGFWTALAIFALAGFIIGLFALFTGPAVAAIIWIFVAAFVGFSITTQIVNCIINS